MSCEKKSPFENELTKDDNCWVYIENNKNSITHNTITYGGVHFKENGIVENIWIVKGIKQKNFNFEKTSDKIDKWHFNKNILSFYDYKFEVISFTKNTLIVKNIKDNKIKHFINMPPRSAKCSN